MEDLELLFFDTFSHEASEEINLDLVQFPKPVLVGEVRIIPLGARVQADFPGGVRLGATNPSQFQIEFFVNDLSKPGASTFEKLGNMDYNQNGNIHLECQHKVATDGLVLRGWYTTITLAIYGSQAKAPAQPAPCVEPVVSAQPEPVWTPETVHPHPQTKVESEFEVGAKAKLEVEEAWDSHRDRADSCAAKQWGKPTQQHQANDSTSSSTPTYRGGRSPSYKYGERGTPEYDSVAATRQREVSTPPARPPSPPTPPPPSKEEDTGGQLSPGSVESISEGDIPCEEEQVQPFEPLSDDDDFPQDMDFDNVAVAGDNAVCNEVLIPVFDPHTFRVKPLQSFKNPVYEKQEYKRCEPDRLSELVSCLSGCSGNASVQQCIDLAEQLVNLLPTSLSSLPDVEEKLMEMISVGVEWRWGEETDTDPSHTSTRTSTKPPEEEPVLKVRSLKVSLRLCEAAIVSSETVAVGLLEKHNLLAALFQLYHMEWMALSLKLLMLRVVDSLLSYRGCLERIVETVDSETQQLSVYQRLIKLLQDGNQHARLNFSVASILSKIHFYELCLQIQHLVKWLEKDEEDGDGEKLWTLSLCLQELCSMYISAPQIFSKPKRFLPVSAVFEAPQSSVDPRVHLYAYFEFTDLISNLLWMLMQDRTKREESIRVHVLSLIENMGRYNHGLVYLSSHSSLNKLLASLNSFDLTLSYRLRTLELLDDLAAATDIDSFSTIDTLHSLSTLTINKHVGKSPILQVLTYDSNLSILLDLLVKKSIYKKKSPSRGYIIDLIVSTFKTCLDIRYLRIFAGKISELSKGEFSELKEVTDGLKPCLIKNAFDYSNVAPIFDFVKSHVDSCTNLSGELVTAVRLLRLLAVGGWTGGSTRAATTRASFTELKYKYVLLQIYSMDGLTHFTSILSKLCKKCHPVFGDTSLGKRSQVVYLIQPILELMRLLLTEVIGARGCEFKDMSCVGVLLTTYQLLSTMDTSEASDCRHHIIQSLLAFTQAFDPTLPANSAWSLMITQVVNWVSDTPRQNNSGLSVLNQLLPLPLPVSTLENLTEEQIATCVSGRRAWAAVLAPTCLPSLLAALSHTAHASTAQAVYSVALRYSDLAAPSALSMVRALLDTPPSARSVAMLSALSCHAPVKAALLQTVEPESWSPLLESHLEWLLPCVESLCDWTISLGEPHVSSNLPPPRVLAVTIPHLVRKLNETQTMGGTMARHVLTILRILRLLSQHDYGLYHIHKLLEVDSGWCCGLLEHRDDQVKRSTVELGLVLGSTESPPSGDSAVRSQVLPASCLASLYSFNPQDYQKHPLQAIARGDAGNDTTLKSRAEMLLQLLTAQTTPSDTSAELTEPVQESGEAMLSELKTRSVYQVVEKSCSKRTSAFSLPSYIPPSNHSNSLISLDLGDIAKTDLKGWDLNQALCQLCSKQNSLSACSQQGSQPKQSTTNATNKPAFGVGGGRGGGRGGGVSADMFRSRAANTSRPPSLHVDDFVALETCGAQPTGPTGYNKLTMMAAQDILGMRGGASGVMRGGRPPPHVERTARFFNQPPYLPPQHHFPIYYPPHPHF